MKATIKHLWEIKHAYYCHEGNYFTNEACCDRFKSWESFAEEYRGIDKDYNLMFRYDWTVTDDGQDVLKIFWMGQRKGRYRYSIVNVLKSDEPKIIEFLLPFWKYLEELWSPISKGENKLCG